MDIFLKILFLSSKKHRSVFSSFHFLVYLTTAIFNVFFSSSSFICEMFSDLFYSSPLEMTMTTTNAWMFFFFLRGLILDLFKVDGIV